MGKYVVVDCIGRGGNGLILKARHTLLPNRHVALKTLDARNLHGSSEALARFRREIDIVARLEHPNIVRAYDVLQTRRQIYLVLEFIEGCDLGSVVRDRGALPVPEAIVYIVQAGRGLGYAHRCGIVHRDFKPGNLLLTRDGLVKLSDLGLARFFPSKTGPVPANEQTGEETPELTMKGLCLGTPEFMAPEQAEDASRADARSDLYSLGATLFHLLSGELPVPGVNRMQRITRLLTEPSRSLAEVRADIPTELVEMVRRLMARDPAERPGSAEEAISVLEPFAHDGNAAAAPAPWDGRRKMNLVLSLLQGQLNPSEACARHGLAMEELELWKQRFLQGAEHALDPNVNPGEDYLAQYQELLARIGAQSMEIEALKKQLKEKGAKG